MMSFARRLGESLPAAVLLAVGATRDPPSSPFLRNGTLPGGGCCRCVHSTWGGVFACGDGVAHDCSAVIRYVPAG